MLKTVLARSAGILGNHIRANYSSGQCKKVAVILSGCGVYDGTEIHEASATAVHLTRHDFMPVFYAPEIAQAHVINHLKGEVSNEVRCVMAEAARIARGNVKPIAELKNTDVSGVIFPGGFGAAKNLSTFASAGTECTLNIEVCRVIQEFHKNKKPMAFMCIAPILVARVIPNVKITLGKKECNPDKWPYSDAIDAAIKMGACVEDKGVDEVCIDCENLVLSTPAFMYNGYFHEIFDGIGNLVDQLKCIIKKTSN